jgi:hypothetical protein
MDKKKRKWKGVLAKPIRGPTVLEPQGYVVVPENWDPTDEPTECCERAIARSWVDKLPLLFEHYGIEDHSDYFSLSLALAIDHVPGFSVKEVPYKLGHGDYGAVVPATETGRPREWTGQRLHDLLEAVNALKERKKIATDKHALRELARRDPWRSPPSHRGEAAQWVETLEARLQEAKSIDKRVEFWLREADKQLKHLDK